MSLAMFFIWSVTPTGLQVWVLTSLHLKHTFNHVIDPRH
jgi:hypothetical protein